MASTEEIKKPREQVGFRLGEERLNKLDELTKLANFPKRTHFIAALIDHLHSLKSPFDVRDIVIKTKK